MILEWRGLEITVFRVFRELSLFCRIRVSLGVKKGGGERKELSDKVI